MKYIQIIVFGTEFYDNYELLFISIFGQYYENSFKIVEFNNILYIYMMYNFVLVFVES